MPVTLKKAGIGGWYGLRARGSYTLVVKAYDRLQLKNGTQHPDSGPTLSQTIIKRLTNLRQGQSTVTFQAPGYGETHTLVRNVNVREAKVHHKFEPESGYASAVWLTLVELPYGPGQTTWAGLRNFNSVHADDSDFESTQHFSWSDATNVASSQSTAQARTGTHSRALSSLAAGNVVETLFDISGPVAGEVWTGGAYFRAAASPRSIRVDINWRNSGGGNLGTTTGTAVADTTSGWTFIATTSTAPANTATARMTITVLATGGASEVHYVDDAFFSPGTLTSLTLGRTWASLSSMTWGEIRESVL